MLTGFIQTNQDTLTLAVNPASLKLTDVGKTDPAKYYLYSGNGIYKGSNWQTPITINNVYYVFDADGKVMMETALPVDIGSGHNNLDGNWKYEPLLNRWTYSIKDSNGNEQNYRNGVYPIMTNGVLNYYAFDEQGYMLTGTQVINGKTYHLQETGSNVGAVVAY